MYINKAILYGNLTRDPELKSLPSGVQVSSFGLATNKVYKDKDGNKKEQTEFHNIVLFARLAELSAQYLKKGSPVYIEGRIQTRSWDADGGKKYRTEIVGETMQFGPKSTGGSGNYQKSNNGSSGFSKGSTSSGAGSHAESKNEKGNGEKMSDSIEYPQEEINPDDIPF
jgi:single-strand DNA-binding protein